MVQNIGFSLAVIGVLIPLAAFGVLGLAMVVLIHELAEVLVILNAIRAARTRPPPDVTAAPTTTNANHHTNVAASERSSSDLLQRHAASAADHTDTPSVGGAPN